MMLALDFMDAAMYRLLLGRSWVCENAVFEWSMYTAMVLSWGVIFDSKGTFSNVWRHFWLSQLAANWLRSEMLNILQSNGQPPTIKNYLVQNVHRAEVEKA